MFCQCYYFSSVHINEISYSKFSIIIKGNRSSHSIFQEETDTTAILGFYYLGFLYHSDFLYSELSNRLNFPSAAILFKIIKDIHNIKRFTYTP